MYTSVQVVVVAVVVGGDDAAGHGEDRVRLYGGALDTTTPPEEPVRGRRGACGAAVELVRGNGGRVEPKASDRDVEDPPPPPPVLLRGAVPGRIDVPVIRMELVGGSEAVELLGGPVVVLFVEGDGVFVPGRMDVGT